MEGGRTTAAPTSILQLGAGIRQSSGQTVAILEPTTHPSNEKSHPFVVSPVEPWTRRSLQHSPVENAWVDLYDSLQAMAFHVYILRCSDRSYYTGHTDRLETRLIAHERGEFQGYTQNRLPVHLVFAQEMPSRQDAIAREQQIKGWSRAKKKP